MTNTYLFIRISVVDYFFGNKGKYLKLLRVINAYTMLGCNQMNCIIKY